MRSSGRSAWRRSSPRSSCSARRRLELPGPSAAPRSAHRGAGLRRRCGSPSCPSTSPATGGGAATTSPSSATSASWSATGRRRSASSRSPRSPALAVRRGRTAARPPRLAGALGRVRGDRRRLRARLPEPARAPRWSRSRTGRSRPRSESLAREAGAGADDGRGAQGARADARGERRGDRCRPDDPRDPLGHAARAAGRAGRGPLRRSRTSSSHIARDHLWKGVAWFALLALPCAVDPRARRLVRRPARAARDGGRARCSSSWRRCPPRTRSRAATSARRTGRALRLTRDPAAAEALYRRFARTSLTDPDPPLLLHLLLDTHPTLVERIATSLCVERLGRTAPARACAASGRSWMPLDRRATSTSESSRASSSSLRELRRHVHAGHDDAGDVALLDLVVDPREGERELVVREADVREVRVDAGEVRLVDLDVELALADPLVHVRTIQPHDGEHAIRRLAAAIGALGRAPRSALERPSDAAHGDYATNVALRLAGAAQAAAAGDRGGARAPSGGAAAVERAEVAGPGFVNLWLAAAWYGEALAELLERGSELRRRLGRDARARPGGDGVGEPDRPDHRRGGPERRVRRLRRAPARVRRPRRRARVLLQRRRRPDGALPRLGRGGAARGGAARGRLPRRVHRSSWRSSTATRCRAMLRADRGDARALPDPLRQLGEAERARAAPARVPAAAGHVRAGRRRLGALVRVRRRGATAC